MKAHRLAAAACLLAALAPAPARAADDDDPAACVARGVDRFRQEDYEGARAAFAQAYAIAPSTRVLFNLALAELQSGHPVESARHLRAYLGELEAEPEKIRSVRAKWLPRAESLTSRLHVDAPAGTEIAVDGRSAGTAPLEALDVAIGEHAVAARAGAWSREERVTTRPGEILPVHFAPPAAPQAAPAPPASPPAPAPAALPAAVAMPRAMTSPVEGTADARPTSSVSLGPPPAPVSATKLVTEAGLLCGAILATGFGALFAVASHREADSAAELLSTLPPDPAHHQCVGASVPAACAELQAHNQTAADDSRVSDGLYIAGGALAAGAIVAWLVWPKDGPGRAMSRAPAIVPTLARDRLGLALGGAF